MSPQTLTSLLVGSYFRPPAKQIIAALPRGAKLSFFHESDNPYDPNALKVLVDFREIPEEGLVDLDLALTGTGWEVSDFQPGGGGWDQATGKAEIFLGYVAASGGKPLLKDGKGRPGNLEFLAALQEGNLKGQVARGRLGFDAEGKPLVTLNWEEDKDWKKTDDDRKFVDELEARHQADESWGHEEG